ncbi:hypothetical protein H0P95_004368 [Salmonella enterica]|nr:hypothetical protein [Salmonella enterica]
MSFFSYFRLRTAQQVLCVSYSVPVAVLLTAVLSPFGTWSGGLFFMLFATLMVLAWGGLALYTRETDRLRHLTDSPEVAVSRGKTLVGIVTLHEKAQLVWEVLQDDALIRSQMREWWRTVSRFIHGAFIYLPAIMLMTSWMVFWLVPEEGIKIIGLVRECPAESVVRWAVGGLTAMYVITGLLWVTACFVVNQPVNGFREAYLAKVVAHQQRRNAQPAADEQDAHTHTEHREDEK